jgi:AcrR family transcriptional regulator
VTLEAIAIEAGIAPAQAIEHYPTLDHCLTAAFEEGTARFREAFDAALEREGSLQERMRAATAASVEELDLHPELGRFCVVEAWRCELPMLRASRLAVRRRYLETMTALGDHDSSDVRTEVMVAAGHHAASEELEQGRPEALRERLDGLIDLFEPAEPSPVA